jgi:hypothetical protein
VTTLRASQIQTLEVVERHDSLTPYELSSLSGKPYHDSRARLAGLDYEGFLSAAKGPVGWSYRLTNKGRSELSGGGGS